MLKYLIPVLLLTAGAIYLATSNETVALQASQDFDNAKIYKEFMIWKNKFNRNYNGNDEEYRFNVFKSNYLFVQKDRAESKKSTVGLNNMADLTNEEYQQKYLNLKKSQQSSTDLNAQEFKSNPNFKAADEVNWVAEGAVAPVQDQGACGSCWAFGSVGGLEGAYFVATGELVKLSEQQLVDCNTTNLGCMGGDELAAYAYTQQQGIMTETSYPYFSGTTGKRGECKYNESDVVFKNTGSFKTKVNDPQEIVEAITQQPLSKGIAAGSIYFQLYSGGVMSSEGCGTGINHSVTMVGYSDIDQDEDLPYWVIKNSWGPDWGWGGYMKIEKQMEHVDGICAINMDTTGATYEK